MLKEEDYKNLDYLAKKHHISVDDIADTILPVYCILGKDMKLTDVVFSESMKIKKDPVEISQGIKSFAENLSMLSKQELLKMEKDKGCQKGD